MWRMSLIFITGVINHPADARHRHGTGKNMGIPKNWRGKWTICLLVFWRSSVFLCCRCVSGCYQSADCRNIPENVSLLSPSVSRQTREQQIAGIRPRFLPTLKTNGRGPWTWNIAFKNIPESEFYDWLKARTVTGICQNAFYPINCRFQH